MAHFDLRSPRVRGAVGLFRGGCFSTANMCGGRPQRGRKGIDPPDQRVPGAEQAAGRCGLGRPELCSWKSIGFDAFGIAIRGDWASIRFGAPRGGGVNLGREIKGLGVTYEKLVEGLTGKLAIEKESSVGESQKWIGLSADRSIRLEIYGRESDIAETAVGIAAKLGPRSQVNPDSRDTITKFLANIAPDWFGRDKSFNDSLRKLIRNPGVPQTVNIENKTFEMKIGADKALSLTARPNGRTQTIEL